MDWASQSVALDNTKVSLRRFNAPMQRTIISIRLRMRRTSRPGLASKLDIRLMVAAVVWAVSFLFSDKPKQRIESADDVHTIVASDLVFENMTLNSLSNTPFTISQCTTFSGTAGNCSSSEFQIKDIVWASTTGTTSSADVASFQCSAVKPCTNLTIEDVSLTTVSTNDVTSGICVGMW